jgi:hypothetical protein
MGESGDRNLYLFETDKMPQESYVVRGGQRFNVITGQSRVC